MRRATWATILAISLLFLVACQSPAVNSSPSDSSQAAILPTLSSQETPTPTPTATPTATGTATATPTLVPTPTKEPMMLTILYDNYQEDQRLQTAWGFACLIERGTLRILFDTGGDASTLLANMETLGIDPSGLDAIVLSHNHSDHVGGLPGLFPANDGTTLYLPHTFPARFQNKLSTMAEVIRVEQPMMLAPGIYTTGAMGKAIVEQALVVETAEGAWVITGCAHPGVVEIVTRAKETVGDPIDLVIGGFHLGGASGARIEAIIEDLKALGVRRVAPCHCSGDQARRMFQEAYDDAFVRVGVGTRLEMNP